MTTQSEILNYLTEHKKDFRRRYKVVKIGLFGSYARNEQHERSDIDILVEFAPNTIDLFDKKNELKALIKSKFDREVDICREKYIKPIFKEQILNQAIYV